MEPARNEDEDGAAAPHESARALFLRLLQRLTRGGAQAPADEASDSLRPPGQRSGSGSESLAPYLDHYRNSRPGPLE
jgi:hypothetical protein